MIIPPLPFANIKWAIALLAISGIWLHGYSTGHRMATNAAAQAQLEIATAHANETAEKQATADRLAAENATLASQRQSTVKTITKEVIRYVQKTPADRRCTLPGSFRLLHDAAALGDLPAGSDPGTVVDAAIDPVEDAAVLETVTDNYATCRESIARLEGWKRRQTALESASR